MREEEKPVERDTSWRNGHRQPFDVEKHGDVLTAILDKVHSASELSQTELSQILRSHTLPTGDTLSKDRVIAGYRALCRRAGRSPDPQVIRRLRIKPTRTISGVAPVAVLTQPHPCPGECIFCPEPAGMPKSYLPDEPGAMRAAAHDFDPYRQTASRIAALREIGHSVDKIELLILGGSWSAYPESYQVWFVSRCLDAMNEDVAESLEEAQWLNETAQHRNVGLVVETRPDLITSEEVQRLRGLGATKVQLGIQSLNDEVLALNKRGHTTDDTRRAMRLLRLGGFKTVVHWMPNLLGATPEGDLEDFRKLWGDPALRPDELKIYPTALLRGTELYKRWEDGEYEPYDEETMVKLVSRCKTLIEPYCRLNRLMRDIPAPNIVAGVKKSNLRQIAQQHLAQEGLGCRCIRCREVRGEAIDPETLRLESITYDTDVTGELFLEYVTPEGDLAGFLRLSLPKAGRLTDELEGCAMIRELHVYGPALSLGTELEAAPQHAGLGTSLTEEAKRIAQEEGYPRLAVIAAIGTRPYYRERGFERGQLYMISTP
ncbi:MAG: tRNA uridine(34) 5-carboxymethylaminomethyl modification radical SAM/GNAT enzyme Elp3 [Anaerolineae bacterium]|jgi:elongator complex protein 3